MMQELANSSTPPAPDATLGTLGLIAGNRSLPLVLAQQARAMGVQRLVAIAFEGETDPSLGDLVDQIHWVKVGQLSRMINAFTSNGVRQCVMAGQVAPRNLFDVRPDLRALTLLLKIKEKNAHTIFGALADEFKREGIELIEATPYLKPLMPQEGFAIGPPLDADQQKDVQFGFQMAKQVARLEIGQTIVVKNGAVLAVEAFEGTDKCILRGGELAGQGGGAVAIKVAKEKHDMRFDIPCTGLQTIETCIAARIRVIAVEARKTLLLDQPAIEPLLKKHRISYVAVA